MGRSASWQFLGRVGGPWYRVFDAMRRQVSGRLTGYLAERTIADSVIVRSGGRARTLEAGSGPGSSSSSLSRTVKSVYCVCLDIDHHALLEARRQDPSLPLVVGDMHHLPFPDGMFQLVFNSSTVEHLKEPWRAVAEMRRVCDAGGHVFVGVPYACGPLAFEPWIRRTRLGAWLGPVFTRARLDELLQTAGLAPVHHIRYFARFFIGALAVVAGTGNSSRERGAGS